MGSAIGQAIAAGMATLFLIGVILVIRTIKKGIDKVSDIKHSRDEEISKVDLVISKLSHIEIIPEIGKIDYIYFYLREEDEKLFYSIPPEYLKRLRPKLEILVNQLAKNESSYGHQYAERQFYIGDKLIFKWQKDVRI